MKKALVFCIAFVGMICIPLSAQSYSNARPFFFGFGPTYPWGGAIALGTYSQSGWGGTLNVNGRWYKSPKRPFDYEGGGLWEGNSIYDNSFITALRALKEIPASSRNFKFGMEAGPAWIHTSEADHFTEVSGWHLFSSNYTYERVAKNSIGLSLRGKVEWKATRLTGFELGVNTTISETDTYWGIDLIVTAGEYR